MAYKDIKIEREREGRVARLILNRPHKMNALTWETSLELLAGLEEIAKDPKVVVMILTGSGGNFCSGDDITEFPRREFQDILVVSRFHQKMSNFIEEMDKITIAAVEGYAVGGGLELTMVCDLVFAEEGAMFGIPEVDIDTTPGWGEPSGTGA